MMTLPLRELGKTSIKQDQDEGISMTMIPAQPESEDFLGLKLRWHGSCPPLSSSIHASAIFELG